MNRSCEESTFLSIDLLLIVQNYHRPIVVDFSKVQSSLQERAGSVNSDKSTDVKASSSSGNIDLLDMGPDTLPQ